MPPLSCRTLAVVGNVPKNQSRFRPPCHIVLVVFPISRSVPDRVHYAYRSTGKALAAQARKALPRAGHFVTRNLACVAVVPPHDVRSYEVGWQPLGGACPPRDRRTPAERSRVSARAGVMIVITLLRDVAGVRVTGGLDELPRTMAALGMSHREVGAWLRANGSLLRTIDPSDDDDFSDLAPFREIVGGARIVGIGESTHRVHEFYQIRHRLTRFLIQELGFTAVVMESGFAEGILVDSWIRTGAGDIEDVLRRGITYSFGQCEEMREQLQWFRARSQDGAAIHFYGMDLADSSASARPAVQAALSYLDQVDPAYAEHARARLMPLFDYLPADRTGIAWVAPALHAYIALPPVVRYEMTAHIGELAERMQAMRIVYIDRSDRESYEVAYRCAVTARHTDAFLNGFPEGATRPYEGANIRDAAMAENLEWILRRHDRIVVLAANGHLQLTPWSAPPIVPNELTMLGQHLAAEHRHEMVVIATAFGGGELLLHRPHPDDPPGHSRLFTETLSLLDAESLDELLAGSGMPRFLLDLRKVPADGPVAERFAAVRSIMTGAQATPVDPLAAFDAVVYVGEVSPWRHFPEWGRWPTT